jgi:cytochrome c-type biogenesis protein CcmE
VKKRKKTTERFINLLVISGCVSLAVIFILTALRQSVVYFLTPSDIYKAPPPLGKMIRIGGVVESNSMLYAPKKIGVDFTVTDFSHGVRVHYDGALPSLFRTGQGVVVAGSFTSPDLFYAQQVLAKHDETYKPLKPGDRSSSSLSLSQPKGEGTL